MMGLFGVNSVLKGPAFPKYTRQSPNMNQHNYLEHLKEHCLFNSFHKTSTVLARGQREPARHSTGQGSGGTQTKASAEPDTHPQQTRQWISHGFSF